MRKLLKLLMIIALLNIIAVNAYDCGDGICSPGETCTEDSCCNGRTVNLNYDYLNCGECGNSCINGVYCYNGNCGICEYPDNSCNGISCPSGTACINDMCSSIDDLSESFINNTGNFPVSGYLRVYLSRSDVWGNSEILSLIKEKNPRTMPSKGYIDIAQIINPENYVLENPGEYILIAEFDDYNGNVLFVNGKPIRSVKQFDVVESGSSPPCSFGKDLCNDGTCSYKCIYHDGKKECLSQEQGGTQYCDPEESCSCSDCNQLQGPCKEDLICDSDTGRCIKEMGCPTATLLCRNGECCTDCSECGGYSDCANPSICEPGDSCSCPECDGEEASCRSGGFCYYDEECEIGIGCFDKYSLGLRWSDCEISEMDEEYAVNFNLSCSIDCSDNTCIDYEESYCEDSDGFDVYNKGETVSVYKGVKTKARDFCDGDNLLEYYCADNPIYGLLAYPNYIYCPNGCEDGKCVADSQDVCREDDMGKDEASGSSTYINEIRVGTDICLSTHNLLEYYCRNDGTFTAEKIKCSGICEYSEYYGHCSDQCDQEWRCYYEGFESKAVKLNNDCTINETINCSPGYCFGGECIESNYEQIQTGCYGSCDVDTTLCNDLSCDQTCENNLGKTGCRGISDGECEPGEGCICEDCFGKQASCSQGLVCDAETKVCKESSQETQGVCDEHELYCPETDQCVNQEEQCSFNETKCDGDCTNNVYDTCLCEECHNQQATCKQDLVCDYLTKTCLEEPEECMIGQYYCPESRDCVDEETECSFNETKCDGNCTNGVYDTCLCKECHDQKDSCSSGFVCDYSIKRCYVQRDDSGYVFNDDVCDNDNDGYDSDACAGDDCNDDYAFINPSISESCNSLDDDCDGIIDEGCDDDNDNYCDIDMSFSPISKSLECSYPGDCDDINPNINPNATEICENSIDENCNFMLDEGCFKPEKKPEKNNINSQRKTNLKIKLETETAPELLKPFKLKAQIFNYKGFTVNNIKVELDFPSSWKINQPTKTISQIGPYSNEIIEFEVFIGESTISSADIKLKAKVNGQQFEKSLKLNIYVPEFAVVPEPSSDNYQDKLRNGNYYIRLYYIISNKDMVTNNKPMDIELNIIDENSFFPTIYADIISGIKLGSEEMLVREIGVIKLPANRKYIIQGYLYEIESMFSGKNTKHKSKEILDLT
ncbi:hypothetical protein GF327_00220 [Candidatus Woesearchaeota archaeon]|nr:hypothetical protein [Candidatus Woesearchaeota archaeon]